MFTCTGEGVRRAWGSAKETQKRENRRVREAVHLRNSGQCMRYLAADELLALASSADHLEEGESKQTGVDDATAWDGGEMVQVNIPSGPVQKKRRNLPELMLTFYHNKTCAMVSAARLPTKQGGVGHAATPTATAGGKDWQKNARARFYDVLGVVRHGHRYEQWSGRANNPYQRAATGKKKKKGKKCRQCETRGSWGADGQEVHIP